MRKKSYFIDASSDDVKIYDQFGETKQIAKSKTKFYLEQKSNLTNDLAICNDFSSMFIKLENYFNHDPRIRLIFKTNFLINYNLHIDGHNKNVKRLNQLKLKSKCTDKIFTSAIRFLKNPENVNFFQGMLVMHRCSMFDYEKIIKSDSFTNNESMLPKHYIESDSELNDEIIENTRKYLKILISLDYQSIELQYLIRFNYYHMLPIEWIQNFELIKYNGKSSKSNSCGPDLIFRNKDKTIGVEVTSLAPPCSLIRDNKKTLVKPAAKIRINSIEEFTEKVMNCIKDKSSINYNDNSKYDKCDSLKLLIVVDCENLSIKHNWVDSVQAFINSYFEYGKLFSVFDEIIIIR